MKIKVKRENFLDSLQKVSNIIGTRSTLPILSNVLIEASNGKVTLTTTDLEIRIKTEMDAEISESGKTTLPAKKLLSIARELPGDDIDMSTDEKHHTKINSGNSSYRLNGLETEDFPMPVQFSYVRKITMPQDELGRMLGQILYASSSDDSRKVLNGVLFSVKENTFTAVATDGKRLALTEKILESCNGDEGDVIVPAKGAGELAKILGKKGDANLEIGEDQAVFQIDSTTITTKLVDGSYPMYRQVIPTSFSKKIELPVEDFSSALRRVSLVVSESSSFVKVKFEKSILTLSANSTEIGESNETIEIQYDGPELATSFNPVYLSDPFKHIDADKILLQMNDAYSPVAISGGDGFLYVIMPMRKP